MTEYKKKPIRIAANALASKVYEVGVNVIGPLSQQFPDATPYLQFAYYSFGASLAYKQEELNDFTKYLMDHYKELGVDLNSKEFQDGVFVQLETYFKLRVNDKRLVAQEIFSTFCGSPDKPNFPLERYNDTLVKISVEGLKYLVFLQNDILPIRDIDIDQKYEKGNYPQPPLGKSKEWWVDRLKRTEHISNYISKWTNGVYPSTIDVDQIKFAKEEHRQNEVEKKRDSLSDLFLEMEQLGIMRSYSGINGVLGGDGGGYALTPYGVKFMEFIPRLDAGD